MTTVVGSISRESELVAVQLQQEELQAQHDSLLAERLALAFALGADLQLQEVAEASSVLQLDFDAEGLAQLLQVQGQLAELEVKKGECLAQSLAEHSAVQEQDARNSLAVAEALQAQEELISWVAAHDRAFARKLESVEEEIWQERGDEIEDPIDVPTGIPETPGDATQQSAQPTLALQSRAQASASDTPGPALVNTNTETSASSTAAPTAPVGDVECLCCCDRFAYNEVLCAGSEAASSSTSSAGCGHYFCFPCLTEYVRGAVRDRKYPVACPMAAGADGKGCKMRLSREHVLAVLEKHPADQQAFGLLEAEHTIDPGERLYCPHKSCSTLLQRPPEDDPSEDAPVPCPACRRVFCPRCRIPGWHHGYTCAQFQALPAHLRSAEDAAMLAFSARQQWKQCPKCRLMVERSEGCNHMLCRCGANFCYGCGKPYKSTAPTAENVHGTPACGCPLFSVPEEREGPLPGGGAAAGAAGAGGAARRPYRGGRFVRRARCRYSASIHDCPQGPGRCWFWHDEDDDGDEEDAH